MHTLLLTSAVRYLVRTTPLLTLEALSARAIRTSLLQWGPYSLLLWTRAPQSLATRLPLALHLAVSRRWLYVVLLYAIITAHN